MRLLAALIATASLAAQAASQDSAKERGGQIPPVRPEPLVAINFDRAKASDVLALYRQLIPEDLVVDSAIDMGTPVSLQAKGEIPRDKAVAMIEATLMLNGYILLQNDPGVLRVLGPAKFAASQGTPVYYSPAELPKGERVVSYFMALKHTNPNDVVQLLAAQVSPPKPYTKFIVVPNASAVLITESTTVIRQLIGMQPSFDTPAPAKTAPEKER